LVAANRFSFEVVEAHSSFVNHSVSELRQKLKLVSSQVSCAVDSNPPCCVADEVGDFDRARYFESSPMTTRGSKIENLSKLFS
jgi:hypothetical protein